MNRYREGDWVTEAQPAPCSSRILSMLVCSDIRSKTVLALDAIIFCKILVQTNQLYHGNVPKMNEGYNSKTRALEYLPYKAV